MPKPKEEKEVKQYGVGNAMPKKKKYSFRISEESGLLRTGEVALIALLKENGIAEYSNINKHIYNYRVCDIEKNAITKKILNQGGN